jgi:hypothetical protein
MATANTEAGKYICPFIAAMGATGAAAYQYVQQETVSIAGIDYNFAATLDAADTKSLLEAFTVSGNGPSSGAGLNFSVVLSGSVALQTVLAKYIGSALETASPAAGAALSRTLKAQLIEDLKNGLKAAIMGNPGAGAYAGANSAPADNLINTVENLDVTGVDVTVDAAGGAAAMAAGLTDATDGQDRCEVIYTQILPAALNVYMDASENQVTSALPLQGGDVLVFVWDVDLSDVVPAKTQMDVTGAQGTAVAGAYTSNLHYNEPSKRCAFALTMNGSGKIEGLRA